MLISYTKKHRRFLSFLALGLSFSVTTTTVYGFDMHTASTAGVIPAELFNLEIPAELGTVTERYQGRNGKLVIYIQDAHANYDAQKHIAALIEDLSIRHNVRLVAAEGAEGEIETDLFRTFPMRDVTTEVMDGYLRKGELGGPQFAAVTGKTPLTLRGVEEKELYLKNLDEFCAALDSRDEGLRFVKKIETGLKQLKAVLYGKEQRALDRLLGRFRNNHISLPEFLSALVKKAETHGIDVQMFPHITRFSRFASGYARQELRTLNAEALFTEIEHLAIALKLKLVESREEKQLVALEEYALLLRRGFSLELDRGDFKKSEHFSRKFSPGHIFRFLHNTSKKHHLSTNHLAGIKDAPISESLKRIVAFYKTAEQRDAVFADRLRAEMMREKAHTAVLVTGGFHAEGVTKRLRREGVSYITILPAISKLTDHDDYLRLMQRSVEMLNGPAESTIARFLESPAFGRAASESLGGKLNALYARAVQKGAERAELFKTHQQAAGFGLAGGRILTPEGLDYALGEWLNGKEQHWFRFFAPERRDIAKDRLLYLLAKSAIPVQFADSAGFGAGEEEKLSVTTLRIGAIYVTPTLGRIKIKEIYPRENAIDVTVLDAKWAGDSRIINPDLASYILYYKPGTNEVSPTARRTIKQYARQKYDEELLAVLLGLYAVDRQARIKNTELSDMIQARLLEAGISGEMMSKSYNFKLPGREHQSFVNDLEFWLEAFFYERNKHPKQLTPATLELGDRIHGWIKSIFKDIFVITGQDMVQIGMLEAFGHGERTNKISDVWSLGYLTFRDPWRRKQMRRDIDQYFRAVFLSRGLRVFNQKDGVLISDAEYEKILRQFNLHLKPYYMKADPRHAHDLFSQSILQIKKDPSVSARIFPLVEKRLRALKEGALDSVDLVVPAPSMKPWTNQTIPLAAFVSHVLEKPLSLTALQQTRPRNKRRPSVLTPLSPKIWRRAQNAGGLFGGNVEKLQGKTVLIVDDNETTGLTAMSMRGAVYAAGAQKVLVLSFGKTASSRTQVDRVIPEVVIEPAEPAYYEQFTNVMSLIAESDLSDTVKEEALAHLSFKDVSPHLILDMLQSEPSAYGFISAGLHALLRHMQRGTNVLTDADLSRVKQFLERTFQHFETLVAIHTSGDATPYFIAALRLLGVVRPIENGTIRFLIDNVISSAGRYPLPVKVVALEVLGNFGRTARPALPGLVRQLEKGGKKSLWHFSQSRLPLLDAMGKILSDVVVSGAQFNADEVEMLDTAFRDVSNRRATTDEEREVLARLQRLVSGELKTMSTELAPSEVAAVLKSSASILAGSKVDFGNPEEVFVLTQPLLLPVAEGTIIQIKGLHTGVVEDQEIVAATKRFMRVPDPEQPDTMVTLLALETRLRQLPQGFGRKTSTIFGANGVSESSRRDKLPQQEVSRWPVFRERFPWFYFSFSSGWMSHAIANITNAKISIPIRSSKASWLKNPLANAAARVIFEKSINVFAISSVFFGLTRFTFSLLFILKNEIRRMQRNISTASDDNNSGILGKDEGDGFTSFRKSDLEAQLLQLVTDRATLNRERALEEIRDIGQVGSLVAADLRALKNLEKNRAEHPELHANFSAVWRVILLGPWLDDDQRAAEEIVRRLWPDAVIKSSGEILQHEKLQMTDAPSLVAAETLTESQVTQLEHIAHQDVVDYILTHPELFMRFISADIRSRAAVLIAA